MQTITIEQLHDNTGQILHELTGNGEVIVTEGGKPVAILTNVIDNDIEVSVAALRRARAMAAVKAMQDAAKKAGLDRMSLEDINEEIRAARESR
jgi:antitoxin (DNA-binding transcriptional repressor) of toxin-antitoxin stability system